jgi:hypothetical protein
MIGWLIFFGYAFGTLVVARVVAGWMIEEEGDGDTEITVVSIVMGVISGLFWPIVVPLYVVYRLAPSVLIAKPREARLREREDAVAQREAHLRQLERELGVGA